MITLYTFGPAFGLPDASPFVTKAEMLLKLAGLPYRAERGGLRRAPKGKLPYLDDEGRVVADSTLIRWHLEKTYHVDLDDGLTPAQRGTAWAVEKMLEDNFYWAVADARWNHDANFARGPATFFRSVPWPLRGLAMRFVRAKIRRILWTQGLGRHSPADLAAIASRDVAAVADVLGGQPYLMGDKPCGADATVFAFMAGALCPLFDTPIRTAAESHPNLVAYVARMQARYYPGLAPAQAA